MSNPPVLPRDLDERLSDSQALIPVIVQEVGTGAVLMLAWMNRQALLATMTTGEATYWSRSRNELWVKGATSGNRQKVHSIDIDCDSDALLMQVDQIGVACHTGSHSCFGQRIL